MENDLNHNLKPREVYEAKIHEIEGNLDSLTKFNSLNIHRLHVNEIDIL